MNYSKITFKNKSGINLAISNLIYTLDRRASVMDIYDAIEDAKNAEDMVKRLNNVHAILETFSVGRIMNSYIRLNSRDPFGNIHYLTIWK